MLTFHRHVDGRLCEAEGPDVCQVIRAVRPTADEIRQLHDLTGAPSELLSAAADRDERPRTEVDDSCTLLIVRIAQPSDANSDLPYTTVAFGIVLAPRHIVTVCSEESVAWSEMLSGRQRVPYPESRLLFLCFLLMRLAGQYLRCLNDIRRQADEVESAIHFALRNETLIQMLNLEKCLVYFTTSLRANEQVWDRLPRVFGGQPSEEENEAIEDVRIEFRQAKDLADLHSNILSGMMDAFASVISNNLNVVIKVLTSVTIIMMLPTLVASVYGMNVRLPFQDSPHAFAITMAISVAVSIGGLVVFWKLKWF